MKQLQNGISLISMFLLLDFNNNTIFDNMNSLLINFKNESNS